MPSAAPVPRSPSVLTLSSAAELLTRPGCPACRYAAEASDRFFAWFALEAHADPVTITRLCASLGMCPRHTRALIRQPGAQARLTAVYRYLLEAAQHKLAGRGTRLASCPACAHHQAALLRVLDTLLEGLREKPVRERYLELGGLCVPHVHAAVGGCGHHNAAAWVVQASIRRNRHLPSLDVLAGGPDHDAAERARLRAALYAPDRVPAGFYCPVCLAAARNELRALVKATGGDGCRPSGFPSGSEPGQRLTLCADHLRDAALMGGTQAPALLARQAGCQAAALARLASLRDWRRGGIRAGWRRGKAPRGVDDCPVCRARAGAVRQELQQCNSVLRATPPALGGVQTLCMRHVLALQAADRSAGREAADLAAQRTGVLLQELAEAFRKNTWAHRHESRGQESTAWRRAAAFLDGGVFGGCPPPDQ
jgi:hypothetical protein